MELDRRNRDRRHAGCGRQPTKECSLDPQGAVVKTLARACDAVGRLRPLKGAGVNVSTMRWSEGDY
ncbi:MAG: hypothetical protein A3H28_04135 [Acidobacteria bacterium RIFCSPLOWO2_02_FULL_61_28]|nr:MAG: hypothetical protein A3H28_04135 [Acidobacteria bacterium RIFCSPLOWO2_02_FULL_61_28]